MIGERDSAATDLAELATLHQEAAQRRAELGDTVHTLTEVLARGGLWAWAGHAAWLGARAAGQAAWRARRADRPGGTHRQRRAAGGPHQIMQRGAVPAATIAVVCGLAVAFTWRVRNASGARPAKQRSLGPGR